MLSNSAKKTFANLTKIISDLNLKSKIYITQNDGTMASIDDALNYPIFSLSSGPTNSMRGAAFLSGIKDGIVIDIGGTSTDIGMLINSFPKESSIAVEFSGIRTNFRMADVLSIPLGGGSIINQKTPYVSNQSLGNRITTDSLSFNGTITTITDIYTNQNKANFIPPNQNFKLSSDVIKSVENEIYSKISIAVDRMKTDSKNIKAIVVGGGSFIIPKKLDGVDLIKFPEFGEVANAIGSSMAQISGYSEKVFSTTDLSRNEIIEISKKKKISLGIINGRSIWRSNLKETYTYLDKLKNKIDFFEISTSCSLMHLPYSLEKEEALDQNLKSILSFGDEKLNEIALLKESIISGGISTDICLLYTSPSPRD